MASASDNFNRTNSTGLGGNWTAVVENFNIVNNRARKTGGTDTQGLVVHTAQAPATPDHRAWATIYENGPAYVGVAVRASNSQHTGYAFFAGNSDSYLVRYNNGSEAALGSAGAGVPDGGTVRLSATGSNPVVLLVEVDTGSGFAPFTSIAAGGTVNDSSGSRITAAGYAGLSGYGTTSAEADVDNWGFEDIGGPSPATLSSPTPSGTLETETTATVGCTTDTQEGTLYAVLSTTNNVSGASGAQIKAGQNSSSSAADFADDAAVSGASPSVGFTGLTEDTLYYYALVQETGAGFSNVVSGTFTTAEASAQEAEGTGAFGVAIAVTQSGSGQSAVRKLRLTEANDQELRSEIGVLLNISGVNFEWYDKFGNTTGDPDITGTIDIVNGEAVIPLFGSALSASQPGTLILYHPSLNTVNGLYRLAVE